MPDRFINFVMSSVTGACSALRTPAGHQRLFLCLFRFGQGDPLSPILFAFIMDALHSGYENVAHGRLPHETDQDVKHSTRACSYVMHDRANAACLDRLRRRHVDCMRPRGQGLLRCTSGQRIFYSHTACH